MLVIAPVSLPVDVSDLSELLVIDPHSQNSGDDTLSEWQSIDLLTHIHLKKACNKYSRSEEMQHQGVVYVFFNYPSFVSSET